MLNETPIMDSVKNLRVVSNIIEKQLEDYNDYKAKRLKPPSGLTRNLKHAAASYQGKTPALASAKAFVKSNRAAAKKNQAKRQPMPKSKAK